MSSLIPEEEEYKGDELDVNSLESIETPKHVSETLTQHEIALENKKLRREKIIQKAKEIKEKIDKKPVSLGYFYCVDETDV